MPSVPVKQRTTNSNAGRVRPRRDLGPLEERRMRAPDLNPIEQVWGNLKATEVANLCCDSFSEVEAIADDGLWRIGTDAALCFAFLRHCGLRL
jgi:hypothetical protein